MAFRLPRLPAQYTDEQLQRWWQSVCEAVEAQENNQDTLISQIQASLSLAGQGVVGQDASTGTAKSGQATTTFASIDSTTFANGPSVVLSSVTAGMSHLTLTGSGPQSGVSVGGPMDGEYRIVEVGAGVTIFTGSFTVKTLNTGATVIILNNPVNTQIFTRATTGTVTYRLDVRKTAGAGTVSNLQAYLFARRAP